MPWQGVIEGGQGAERSCPRGAHWPGLGGRQGNRAACPKLPSQPPASPSLFQGRTASQPLFRLLTISSSSRLLAAAGAAVDTSQRAPSSTCQAPRPLRPAFRLGSGGGAHSGCCAWKLKGDMWAGAAPPVASLLRLTHHLLAARRDSGAAVVVAAESVIPVREGTCLERRWWVGMVGFGGGGLLLGAYFGYYCVQTATQCPTPHRPHSLPGFTHLSCSERGERVLAEGSAALPLASAAGGVGTRTCGAARLEVKCTWRSQSAHRKASSLRQ